MDVRVKCPGCLEIFDAEGGVGMAECPVCGGAIDVPRVTAPRPGLDVGGFVLERLLGYGGSGEVWLAAQTTTGRQVALKILDPRLSSDEEFIGRFLKEARISAQLDHRNIVTTYDAGLAAGMHYLALSYVEGLELGTMLNRDGLLPERQALQIAADIATALEYAWKRFRLLHRDIKPENIMLAEDGRAMLMDMGISKSGIESYSPAVDGEIIGTPHYMSPEQAAGESKLDCRSDIYSLGATLFHMVVGNPPFDADSNDEVVSKQLNDPLPPPFRQNPSLSIQSAALIEIMMAKDPDYRQKTWRQVLDDITSVLRGDFPAVPELAERKNSTWQQGGWRKRRIFDLFAIAVCAALAVGAAALILDVWPTSRGGNGGGEDAHGEEVASPAPPANTVAPRRGEEEGDGDVVGGGGWAGFRALADLRGQLGLFVEGGRPETRRELTPVIKRAAHLALPSVSASDGEAGSAILRSPAYIVIRALEIEDKSAARLRQSADGVLNSGEEFGGWLSEVFSALLEGELEKAAAMVDERDI